jgi:hypothetical protein
MNGEIAYLTKSEFATKQSWSPSYVTKLGKQGRLVFSPDGKRIDVAATLVILNRTTDPAKEGVRQHHALGRNDKHVGVHTRADAPSDEAPASTPAAAADPQYWSNKARREGALAELAELELAKKRGDLVDRQRVEETAFAMARMLRDTLMGLPTTLAPKVAGMTEHFEIEAAMRDEIRRVLDDFAKMSEQDLDAAMRIEH